MKSNNRSSRAKARRFCNSRQASAKSKGDTPISLVIMHDVTEPLPDPCTGKPSFVRAMAAQLADNRPFECFQQWEWEWLRQDLSVTQIEEGLTEAFEYNPNPSHSCVFQILEAARSRVEAGLPPYGNLWEEPSEEERRKLIEGSRKRIESYRDQGSVY
jgi:hypothetical protein